MTEKPFTLILNRSHWEWTKDDEGSYPSLIPKIEDWAMDNLQRAWAVHMGRREPSEDEMKNLLPQYQKMTIRYVWIEFLEYHDWLLFKMRWC